MVTNIWKRWFSLWKW